MLQSLGLQRVGHDLATEQQYTGYYLALKKKKKENSDRHYNMDEPRGHYAV